MNLQLFLSLSYSPAEGSGPMAMFKSEAEKEAARAERATHEQQAAQWRATWEAQEREAKARQGLPRITGRPGRDRVQERAGVLPVRNADLQDRGQVIGLVLRAEHQHEPAPRHGRPRADRGAGLASAGRRLRVRGDGRSISQQGPVLRRGQPHAGLR